MPKDDEARGRRGTSILFEHQRERIFAMPNYRLDERDHPGLTARNIWPRLELKRGITSAIY